jgi:hypothetical protein
MSLTFYLRRQHDGTGNNEYLFLSAERLKPTLEVRLIDPQIPGNTSTELTGESATNFIINLGSQQPRIQISGFILTAEAADYPDLSNAPYGDGNGEHIPAQRDGDSDTSTVSSQQLGRDVRDMLYDFVADQAHQDYASGPIKLGYPEWSSSENPREWEGMVNQLRSTEVAGEVDQYVYQLTFSVGNLGGG